MVQGSRLDFQPGELTPAFRSEFGRLTLSGGDETFLTANQSRVSLEAWTDFGNTGVKVLNEAMTSTSGGFSLSDQGVRDFRMIYRDVGTIVGDEWHVFSDFGFGDLFWFAVYFDPHFLRPSSGR